MFAQVFFFWRAGLSKKKCHIIYVDKRLSGDTPQVKFFWLGANALETDLCMIRDMTQWIDWWNCIFVSLSQGKRWYLEGTAKVIDPQEPAKLGVNFLSGRYLLYHLYMYIYCFNCYNTHFNIFISVADLYSQFFLTPHTGFCQPTTPTIALCTPAKMSLGSSTLISPGFLRGRLLCLHRWWIRPSGCWSAGGSTFPIWLPQIRAVAFSKNWQRCSVMVECVFSLWRFFPWLPTPVTFYMSHCF